MSTIAREQPTLATKRNALTTRAAILTAIRDFFSTSGYLEVETPILSLEALPEANIEPIACLNGGVLLPSPEISMKRLVGAGYEKIFQIGKCFRAGEVGLRHRPEFTMLEWYRANADYLSLMGECEKLVCFVASRLGHSEALPYLGRTIRLAPPFERMSLAAAFARFAARDMSSVIDCGNFDEVFALEVEPNIPQDKAIFLYDYPLVAGGFAKQKAQNPALTERFEMYIGGLEIANACSEIDNCKENEERIRLATNERASSQKPLHFLSPSFLEETKQMPPCAGAALGVDRLAMLFANTVDIRDVLAFG